MRKPVPIFFPWSLKKQSADNYPALLIDKLNLWASVGAETISQYGRSIVQQRQHCFPHAKEQPCQRPPASRIFATRGQQIKPIYCLRGFTSGRYNRKNKTTTKNAGYNSISNWRSRQNWSGRGGGGWASWKKTPTGTTRTHETKENEDTKSSFGSTSQDGPRQQQNGVDFHDEQLQDAEDPALPISPELQSHIDDYHFLSTYRNMEASDSRGAKLREEKKEVFRLRFRKRNENYLFASRLSDDEVLSRLRFTKKVLDYLEKPGGNDSFRAWGHYTARDHNSVVQKYRDEEVLASDDLVEISTGRRSSSSSTDADFLPSDRNTSRTSTRTGKTSTAKGTSGPTLLVRSKASTTSSSTQTKIPPIVIDDREHKLIALANQQNLFEQTKEKPNLIPFEKKRILTADIVIGDPGREVYLERKTAADFWSSITDARLHNQLGNKMDLLERSPDARAAVILEGFSTAERDPRLRPRMRLLYGKIVNLVLRDRVPIFMTRDLAETYQILVVIAENYYESLAGQQPRDYVHERLHGKKKERNPVSALESMVSMVPGVTERMAPKILATFLKNVDPNTGTTVVGERTTDAAASCVLAGQEDEDHPLQSQEVEVATDDVQRNESCSSVPPAEQQRPTDIESESPPPGDEVDTATPHLPMAQSTSTSTGASMLIFCNILRKDVLAVDKLQNLGLKQMTARLLVQQLVGDNARSLKRARLVEKLSAVPGASESKIKQIVGTDYSAGMLRKRLDEVKAVAGGRIPSATGDAGGTGSAAGGASLAAASADFDLIRITAAREKLEEVLAEEVAKEQSLQGRGSWCTKEV
ncbi:unnamed protein product [Amoebophrya sp. A120]|nr:unnamed protein product [Amoebophrya sp. A120]|eukprot:GSA120T00017211001.1